MIMATVGFHAGVSGTDVAANKRDDINFVPPKNRKINLNHQDYKID
ncbi:hypothetical protein FDUTEX481_02160 [Tolypothrix sp. PCC 7601]|nr:hypothetical protein FDUTEX481_02160 [Tolypothrix sp. PCC 7601]